MPRTELAEHLADGISRFARAVRSSAHCWDQGETKMRRADVVLLRWLSAHGEARLGDIAEAFALDISVISRQVTCLESDGLVARRRDPADGRAALIALSDLGVERLVSASRAYLGHLERAVGLWDDDKIKQVGDALFALSDVLAAEVAREEHPI